MISKPRQFTILGTLCLVALIIGYFSAQQTTQVVSEKANPPKKQKPSTDYLEPNKSLVRPVTPPSHSHSNEDLPLGAIPNERIIRFDNDNDYQLFLKELEARGLTALLTSDQLRAVRFRYNQKSDLSGLDDLLYNFIVTPPTPPDASAQEDAEGFGNQALSWLGLTGDNSQWGSGITVAVIDSGVNAHLAFSGENGTLSFINLTELGHGSDQLGHGTAVASIIAGDFPQTPGVAPASDILSIRVTDETGISDSFTLAEAIIQAVQSGAEVINISMGSSADSPIMADAVAYAISEDSIIVAPSGNEGITGISYPAAYEGVISVGAIEAAGEHVDFSNTGDDLDIAAPGYQVNAAWGEDLLISFSGTSASAPYVSGAIAAVMSENPDFSATEAANVVLNNTNDAGLPGNDNEYGAGILALDRIMSFNTSGIYDAAIAGQVISPDTSNNTALVTIQNQGTETLINSPVTITVNSSATQYNISSLLPGEIHTFSIPISLPSNDTDLSIVSNINTTEADQDLRNNSKTTILSQE